MKGEVRTSTDRLIEKEETVTADPQEKVHHHHQVRADTTDPTQTNAHDAIETIHSPHFLIYFISQSRVSQVDHEGG